MIHSQRTVLWMVRCTSKYCSSLCPVIDQTFFSSQAFRTQ